LGFFYTATENQEEIARRIGNQSCEEKKEADSGQGDWSFPGRYGIDSPTGGFKGWSCSIR